VKACGTALCSGIIYACESNVNLGHGNI